MRSHEKSGWLELPPILSDVSLADACIVQNFAVRTIWLFRERHDIAVFRDLITSAIVLEKDLLFLHANFS